MRFSLKTEDKILLACSSVHLTAEEQEGVERTLAGSVDFDALLAKASSCQVYPLLYANLQEFKKNVPATFWARLKDAYFANLLRSIKIFEEYKKLSKIFSAKKIALLPLKGPIFAEVFYGDMGLRVTSDLDVLVNEGDLERARLLLIEIGYKERGGDSDYNLKYARHYQHHLEFSGKVYLELHWEIARSRIYRFPSRILWEDVRTYNVNGFSLEGLSPTANLIQRFYRVLEDPFLKGLVDIAEILKRFSTEINWEELDLKMKRGNMRNAMFYLSKAAHKILGAPRKPNTKNTLFAFRGLMAEAFVNPEQLLFSTSTLLRRGLILLLMDNMRDVFSVIKQYHFPSAEYKEAFENYF